jgi:hypothetical protein
MVDDGRLTMGSVFPVESYISFCNYLLKHFFARIEDFGNEGSEPNLAVQITLLSAAFPNVYACF